jgi:hypothetical protein
VSRRIPFGQGWQVNARHRSLLLGTLTPCPPRTRSGWSIEPTHRHSRATSHPSRPGLLHVIQIQKES